MSKIGLHPTFRDREPPSVAGEGQPFNLREVGAAGRTQPVWQTRAVDPFGAAAGFTAAQSQYDRPLEVQQAIADEQRQFDELEVDPTFRTSPDAGGLAQQYSNQYQEAMRNTDKEGMRFFREELEKLREGGDFRYPNYEVIDEARHHDDPRAYLQKFYDEKRAEREKLDTLKGRSLDALHDMFRPHRRAMGASELNRSVDEINDEMIKPGTYDDVRNLYLRQRRVLENQRRRAAGEEELPGYEGHGTQPIPSLNYRDSR